MAKGYEVLEMLIPTGGWRIVGDDYKDIDFVEAQPITKADFDAGFALWDAWKAKIDLDAETAKTVAAAKLAALGLTADDLKALGL